VQKMVVCQDRATDSQDDSHAGTQVLVVPIIG